MTLANTLKQILKELDISVPELAKLDNQAYQNLNKKIRNETLSFTEFINLLSLINVKFDYTITMPNNKKQSFEQNDKTKERIDLLVNENNLLKKQLALKEAIDKDVRTSLNNIVGSAEVAETHLLEKNKTLFYLDSIIDEVSKIDMLLYNGEQNARSEEFEVEVDLNHLKNKKALVVEDNELNRDILCSILNDYHIKSYEVKNGLEAVNMIDKNDMDFFDFILMDIEMPIMNGIEATKIIRNLVGGKDIPIIATTSDITLEDRILAKEVGINYYITKPINRDLLLKVLMKFSIKEEN